MQEEAIEDVLAAHGLGDLGVFVVLSQFGKVHHFVLTGQRGVSVNLEHHFLGVAGKRHGLWKILSPLTRFMRLLMRLPREENPTPTKQSRNGAPDYLRFAFTDKCSSRWRTTTLAVTAAASRP